MKKDILIMKRRGLKLPDSAIPLLFPYLILFMIFVVIPVLWTIYLAFHKGGFMKGFEFIGIKNFIDVSHL